MRFYKGKPLIRCSQLDQLISCPASAEVLAKLGKVRDDDRDSWDGQWCHREAATRFVKEHGAVEPEGGIPAPTYPAGWRPEGGLMDWVVDFFEHSVLERIGGDWAMEVEVEMLIEFDGFWLIGHVDVDGIAPDASIVNFEDLKSGTNVVDIAESNWQVLGYAVLFKRRFGAVLKKIRGGIVQPRVREGEGDRVSGVTFDETGTFNDAGERIGNATINTIEAGLEAAILEALKNTRILNSGIKQCRWCDGCLQCPATRADKDLRMKMILTDDALAQITPEADIEVLAEWAIAKKHLGPKLEKAASLLKAKLEKRPGENYVTTSGVTLTLVPWNGQRDFTPEGKARAWEQISAELDESLAYSSMSLSLPAMEKAYAKHYSIPIESEDAAKDSGKKRVTERFGRWITRESGKQLSIVA